jgi:ribA/ribD-fused uncharacterized protein
MTIGEFNGKFAFLSNFHASKIKNLYGVFPTAEHLYQSAKTNDNQDKERIRLAVSPGRAKRMGKNALLRSNWEEIKSSVMLAIVRMKFNQNHDLAKKLLETYPAELIEGNNWHDNEWGDCRCNRCKLIEGQNKLGKILMQVRAEIGEASK